MRVLKAGLLYFALTFAAGFLLGTLRVLVLVPQFGIRAAELMEMPVMFVVIVLAARYAVRRLDVPFTAPARLGMGALALALMLLAEFTLVLRLQGLSLDAYLAGRDPVAGLVYVAMLGVFAILPWYVLRR